MSRTYPRVQAEKRTRSTIWLAKRAKQRRLDQRAFKLAARKLTAWGRSR